MRIPAVHAGTPPNEETYLSVDLDGTPLFIHKDLIDWNIEIYLLGFEGAGSSLTAKTY